MLHQRRVPFLLVSKKCTTHVGHDWPSAASRNATRNAFKSACVRGKGKVKVVFNSNPAEFKRDSVILDVNGKLREIPNDFVWIFAGGEPPTAFLRKIGVGFGMQDMTSAGSREAKQAKEVKKKPSH